MKKRVYIETYGCQMNFSDSEIVGSIMADNNFDITKTITDADIVFTVRLGFSLGSPSAVSQAVSRLPLTTARSYEA